MDTGRVPPGNAATSGKDGQATPPAPVPSFPAPRLSRRFSLRKGYYKDGDLESRPISAAGSLMHIGSRDDGRANESWVPWSPFFPLNVNFVSEITKEAQQCLFGVVVFLSALIVSLVVAGLVVLLYAKREASPLDCVTAECAAARDYLRQLLNTSEDACQDFYGYVCDSWLRRGPHNGSFRRDSFLASLVAINESLLRQLDHRGTGGRNQSSWPHLVDEKGVEPVQRQRRMPAESAHPVAAAPSSGPETGVAVESHVPSRHGSAARVQWPPGELRPPVRYRGVPQAVAAGPGRVLCPLLPAFVRRRQAVGSGAHATRPLPSAASQHARVRRRVRLHRS
ncbi:uncharacterized protein LOC144173496 [Haemaphysalis longicornis]